MTLRRDVFWESLNREKLYKSGLLCRTRSNDDASLVSYCLQVNDHIMPCLTSYIELESFIVNQWEEVEWPGSLGLVVIFFNSANIHQRALNFITRLFTSFDSN